MYVHAKPIIISIAEMVRVVAIVYVVVNQMRALLIRSVHVILIVVVMMYVVAMIIVVAMACAVVSQIVAVMV